MVGELSITVLRSIGRGEAGPVVRRACQRDDPWRKIDVSGTVRKASATGPLAGQSLACRCATRSRRSRLSLTAAV